MVEETEMDSRKYDNICHRFCPFYVGVTKHIESYLSINFALSESPLCSRNILGPVTEYTGRRPATNHRAHVDGLILLEGLPWKESLNGV